MQRKPRWPLAFSVCVAMLLSGGISAQDQRDKPDAKARDRSALDDAIHRDLRGIIDSGANLYNQGDWNGCYRLWEGALMVLRPVLGERRLRSWAKTIDTEAYSDALKSLQSQLGDHPPLKDVIEAGLTNARQAPQLYSRAFVLRVVLDQLRAETTSAVKAKPKKNTDDIDLAIPSTESKKKTPKQPEEKKLDEKEPDENKPQEKKEGKKADGTSHIEGKVTYQGKPLAGGIITFFGKDDAFSARIAVDSSYELNRVKPGEYKITISTKGNAKIPQVPAKYSDPDKSGLTFTVHDGKQEHDIILN